MTLLSMRNIWVEYGDNVILEKLDLEIKAQSFVSVVGPSGAGKSTFLRLLVGQERPSRGQIFLNDKPLPLDPDANRSIVFQKYSVFPHLNVLENVLFGLEVEKSPILGRSFGKTRKENIEIAKNMLDAVGLTHSIEKYPQALSGGMQQRLSIAQALVKKPQIMLLDEAFGALDPGTRGDMHDLILELWRNYNLTIIMVTHDIKEAFKLGTRLLSFDKRRTDPHAPNRFGATTIYDMPIKKPIISS